jgi:hypothetical protein
MNKNDFLMPLDTYINGYLSTNEESHIYNLNKKNVNDTKLRIEFSSSSECYEFKIVNNTKNQNNEVEINPKNILGKKVYDIDFIDDNSQNFTLKIMHKTGNITEFSYSLRYRTDEGTKTFINYEITGEHKTITSTEIKNENNTKTIQINIPPVKKSNELVDANYYLKIYEKNEKSSTISDTIAIVDEVEPLELYYIKCNDDSCNKIVNISSVNSYIISVIAVTPDKELLSYKSIEIIGTGEDKKTDEPTGKQSDEETETQTGDSGQPGINNDGEENKENSYTVVFVIIIVVLVILLAIFIILYILKRNKSQAIELEKDIALVPVNENNNAIE